MYCKSCGESLTSGARFCGKCGMLVEVARSAGFRCPKCGATNPPEAKFCRQDGTPLVDTQFASQEPVAEAPVAPQVGRTPADEFRPIRIEPPPEEATLQLRPVDSVVIKARSGGNTLRLWLALGALLALVGAGGGYWYYKSRSTSPQVEETASVEGPQAPGSPSAPPNLESDVLEGPPMPATNDTPPPAPPQVADVPNVQIGDRWVTEVVDHQDATLSYRAERTATDVGPNRIVTAVRTLGKDYVRTVEYNGQWALVATHLRSGATTIYSPALPYLSFPLQPGKSWEARVVETDAEGNQRIHEVRARTESWETVQVPAGAFMALKIVLTDDISKDGVVIQRGQDVSWYAPEARRTVKTEETSFDPVTGERRRRTVSLLEYALQSAQDRSSSTVAQVADFVAVKESVLSRLGSVGDLKAGIAEQYGESGEPPSACDQVDAFCPEFVTVREGGVIVIDLQSIGAAELDGAMIQLTPSRADNGDVVWACASNAPSRYLWAGCIH